MRAGAHASSKKWKKSLHINHPGFPPSTVREWLTTFGLEGKKLQAFTINFLAREKHFEWKEARIDREISEVMGAILDSTVRLCGGEVEGAPTRPSAPSASARAKTAAAARPRGGSYSRKVGKPQKKGKRCGERA